jgi:2-iminobutanoate/2-iminopropanoate deaminase
VKSPVRSDGAPAPIGPYSQGIVASGRFVFVAGQGAKDPVTGQLPADIEAQTERCLENVKAIVETAGAKMADVVKVNAYLSDIKDFAAFNGVYARYFSAPYPARTTVGAVLPGGGMLVEIDVIVCLPS